MVYKKKISNYSVPNNIGSIKNKYSNKLKQGNVSQSTAAKSAVLGTLALGSSAGSVALGLSVPFVGPVLIGVLLTTAFVMRQVGLNRELLSNLFFIKMEVERIGRIHSVIKIIAKEKNINLNTANLAICMSDLRPVLILNKRFH